MVFAGFGKHLADGICCKFVEFIHNKHMVEPEFFFQFFPCKCSHEEFVENDLTHKINTSFSKNPYRQPDKKVFPIIHDVVEIKLAFLCAEYLTEKCIITEFIQFTCNVN